jgi:hypothetical protein
LSAIFDLNDSGVFVDRRSKNSSDFYPVSFEVSQTEVDGCANFDPLASVVSAGVTGLERYSGTLLGGGFASG